MSAADAPGDDRGPVFAPPPFRPDQALLTLRRALRDRALVERAGGFELRGRRVAEVAVEAAGAALVVRLARRPALATPEWDTFTLRSAADQRRLLDELGRRLQRWQHDD